ncbi:MAG TPA: CvpA family protein [Candidatus Limnocylindrales bacterium]
MTPFDLVMFLALFAMFVVGYAQGITRRLLGIAAILFSLVLAAQLRNPLGGYLASEWTNLPADYGYMVGFLAVFVASAVTLSFGIQISYKPAPLLWRYPVLDELLGGVLGVIEGLIIFMALVIIFDPYYGGSTLGGVSGEFQPLRQLAQFMQGSLFDDIFRQTIVPGLFAVLGFLFPTSTVDFFKVH